MVQKKQDKGQAKAEQRQKEKLVEDKTFGLKNKNKSKTVQKMIKGMQHSVSTGGKIGESAKLSQQFEQKSQKKKQEAEAALLNSLFKATEKVKQTADQPATVIDYDPKESREQQKMNVYIDQRIQKLGQSQDKLLPGIKPIPCKNFIDAIQKKHYGWFWVCPNGDDCSYSHCVPLDYVFDTSKNTVDEDDEDALEDRIDDMRKALPASEPTLTKDMFSSYLEELALQDKASQSAEKRLTGRDLFSFNPTLFVDDDDAAFGQDYEEDELYWDSVINQNQVTLDQSNKEALDRQSTPSIEEGDKEKNALKKGHDDDGIKHEIFLDHNELDSISPNPN